MGCNESHITFQASQCGLVQWHETALAELCKSDYFLLVLDKITTPKIARISCRSGLSNHSVMPRLSRCSTAIYVVRAEKAPAEIHVSGELFRISDDYPWAKRCGSPAGRNEFDVTAGTYYFPHMSSVADKLEQQIKSLPDDEKMRLVEVILSELDKPDPEIDLVWAEEARRRWAAYKAGRTQTVSYEEVMSKHRNR